MRQLRPVLACVYLIIAASILNYVIIKGFSKK